MEKWFYPLICPVCQGDLHQVNKTFRCPRSHTFDMAKEGYVNLWLAGRKSPKILGDAKEMLRARRRFLERGFYRPLIETIKAQLYPYFSTISEQSEPSQPRCLADIGCGEGYYIGQIKRYLEANLTGQPCRYFGMDLSKTAARLAARRYKTIHFFVGDVNQKILFSDRSITCLLNIFAPRNVTEFERVLAPNGHLLVVIPAPNHLANLRTELRLLDIETNKEQRVIKQFAPVFSLTKKYSITFDLSLTGEDLSDLVQMTPNYWHLSNEHWASLRQKQNIQSQVSFTLLIFGK